MKPMKSMNSTTDPDPYVLIRDLNPPQQEAVLEIERPLLVLAGAGSGKTRVITHRIAHLIQNLGVEPQQILAVTFTNKAAQEMKSRIGVLVGAMAKRVWVNTFHSACVRILRMHGGKSGVPRDFVIYDQGDQRSLVKQCVKELGIHEDLYPPKSLAARISSLKNRLVSPGEFEREAQSFGWDEKILRTYRLYQTRLRENRALDFDDLIMVSVDLLRENPDIRNYYQSLFSYVMIDEYQDTNPAQYHLTRLLIGDGNLCVVGDDDQSIYAFRGADHKHILEFERDFSNVRVIKLEQNYRSTQNILSASSHLVSKNLKRKNKTLWTEKGDGEKITLCELPDQEKEAITVSVMIQDFIKKERAFKECCILYRTHAQSRALEDGLRNKGIPYRIIGGGSFL